MLTTIPVSSMVTRSRIREFMVTRFSLEQYHSCSWTVSADRESADFLKALYPGDNYLPVIEREASHIKGENEAFMPMIMNKLTAMRESINQHGGTLFIDSDHIFTAELPLKLFSGAAVIASDHHIPRSVTTEKYGIYNVGMIFCRFTSFIDDWEWRCLERFDPDGLEQKPFELALIEGCLPYKVFSKGCNVGWWRHVHDKSFLDTLGFGDGKVYVAGEEVINFHVHSEKGVGRDIEEPFVELILKLLELSGKPQHADLKHFIKTTLER
jgi:hypothetical protein